MEALIQGGVLGWGLRVVYLGHVIGGTASPAAQATRVGNHWGAEHAPHASAMLTRPVVWRRIKADSPAQAVEINRTLTSDEAAFCIAWSARSQRPISTPMDCDIIRARLFLPPFFAPLSRRERLIMEPLVR